MNNSDFPSPYIRNTTLLVLLSFFLISGTPWSTLARSLSYDTTTVTVRTASDTVLGRITARVANTPVKRYMGLRHVVSLDTDAGMVFIYSEAGSRNFTMADMKIPLDILYADNSGRIISIHSVHPGTTSIPSREPARYVLEVNHGWSQARNVQPGDELHIDQ